MTEFSNHDSFCQMSIAFCQLWFQFETELETGMASATMY